MSRPKRHRYCIGCGKDVPKHPVANGWRVTQKGAKGMGSRWYYHCGKCLSNNDAVELADRLFEDGLDYPKYFPVKGKAK